MLTKATASTGCQNLSILSLKNLRDKGSSHQGALGLNHQVEAREQKSP